MKKDYSSLFDHYYGLQYDNNVNAVMKVHQLMENAGIGVSATTKDKLEAYSDKRPFKVHYFISKTGKKLKWCPTNSADKLAKMTLKPAEWWIEQLEGSTTTAPTVNIPTNWLDQQAAHVIGDRISQSVGSLGVSREVEERIITKARDVIAEATAIIKASSYGVPNPFEEISLDDVITASEIPASTINDDLPF